MQQIQKPKKVVQYTLQGKYVKTWVSASWASKSLNLQARGIKNCCSKKNRVKSVGGFIWVYEDEKDNLDYYLVKNISLPKKVNQYDKEFNLVKTWDSIYQICKENNYSSTSISNTCNHKNKTAYGYIWLFEADSKIMDKDYYNNRGKIEAKKVAQYNKDMTLLKVWDSVTKVAKSNNWSSGHISNACNNKVKTAYGYIWKYKIGRAHV